MRSAPTQGDHYPYLIAFSKRRGKTAGLPDMSPVDEHAHPHRAVLLEDAAAQPWLFGNTVGQGFGDCGPLTLELGRTPSACNADRQP